VGNFDEHHWGIPVSAIIVPLVKFGERDGLLLRDLGRWDWTSHQQ
jgi:hypothetical protein